MYIRPCHSSYLHVCKTIKSNHAMHMTFRKRFLNKLSQGDVLNNCQLFHKYFHKTSQKTIPTFVSRRLLTPKYSQKDDFYSILLRSGFFPLVFNIVSGIFGIPDESKLRLMILRFRQKLYLSRERVPIF